MRLAAAIGTAQPTASIPAEQVMRPGESFDESQVKPLDRNLPSFRFARVHAGDVLALMGVVSLSYSSSWPDTVKLKFDNYDLAHLADSVLKDSVLGAHIVYADRNGTAFDMSQPAADWTYTGSNLGRAVSTLPGVSNYRWNGNTLLFNGGDAENRVRLQQLVNRKLGDSVVAYWKGECFGPGCKPDPKPPTGEV